MEFYIQWLPWCGHISNEGRAMTQKLLQDRAFSEACSTMLKQSGDGLSKVWKVYKSNDPFFSGGKVEVAADETQVICMYEENVSIVNLGDGVSARQIFQDEETTEPVASFARHPANEEIVVATQKGALMHLNAQGEVVRTFKAHQMPILCMAYDPYGVLVVTGSADRTVRVWDVIGGFCTHSFRDHTDIVRSVTFHPDRTRQQVISTSDDNTIRVFDLRDSKCVAVFRTHVSSPTAVAFSPDGYIMASCGRDKVVNFYELRGYTHIKTVPVMEELEGVAILSAAHSQQLLSTLGDAEAASKLVLVTAGESGVLKFFAFSMAGKDASTFEITALLHFPLSAAVRQGGVTADGNSAATAVADKDSESLHGIASLHYLPKTGELLSVTKDYNLTFYHLSAFQQHLKQQRSRASGNKTAPSSSERIEPSRLLIGSQGEILDMALIPSREEATEGGRFQLALITNSPQVRIVDEQSNCAVLEGHRDIVLCVDATPDGEYIVTSSKDRRCLVWSVRDRSCVAVGEGHTDAIGAVCVSQSKATYASRAAFVASGAADRILKRWALPVHSFSSGSSSAAKLVATHSVRAHDKDINAVAVSPNDALIATASQDKSVRLWRSSDLGAVATLNGHKRGVWKVCFSPIDKVLVSCSGDRTVKMWSVVDHCLLRTFEGHTASVLAVKFVNRGSQLVSASADGLIRVWTIRTGECETTLDTHTDRVWALECLDSALTEAAAEPAEPAEGPESEKMSAGLYFFSGGSDSRLIQWKDATAEEERNRMHDAERTLLLEQQMQNDLRNKRYDKALATALDLGHSLKVLNILTAILEAEGGAKNKESSKTSTADGKRTDQFTSEWSRRLDPYVKAFTAEQLEKVIGYLKEWNTNARHCYVSQVLINALLRLVRAEPLMNHRVVLEALPALLSYSERHYQRLDRLNQASYMLEYFASMIALLPEEDADRRHTGAAKALTNSASGAAEHSTEVDEPLVLFHSSAAASGSGTDGESSDEEDSDGAESDAEAAAPAAAVKATATKAPVQKKKGGTTAKVAGGDKRKACADAKSGGSKGAKKSKVSA